MRDHRLKLTVATLTALLWVTGAVQALSPEDRCEADKNKEAGKYAFCRQRAEAKAIKKGLPPDYSKCDAKLLDKWERAEQKAIDRGTSCIDSVTDSAIQSFVTAHADAVAVALDGGALVAAGACGNGVAETGKSCDGGDLNSETCATLGYAAGAGLACTAECRLDTSGCEALTVPSRFRDNGDGTATDVVSGLMWEIKNDLGGIHDKDNAYTWCTPGFPDIFHCEDPSNPFDGTAKTQFLDVLNDVAGGGASCFADHCDWRLPTILELKGLLLEPSSGGACSTSPCVDPDLPGDTASFAYWSTTVLAGEPEFVWEVLFSGGSVGVIIKYKPLSVRAVRGGL